MNKDQVIEVIKTSINQNVITREEIIAVAKTGAVNGLNVESPRTIHDAINDEKESNIPKVLYSIGGVIAVTGILVLLGNNWDAIGFIGRWLVTVGLGLATFIGAFMVYKKPEYNVLTQVLFSISSVALFIGGFVWLNNYCCSPTWDGSNMTLYVSSALFVIFATALYASRKSILHIIATVFFTIAYYASVMNLLKDSGFTWTSIRDIVVYASMILAIGYFMYNSWIEKGTFTQSLGLSTKKAFSSLYTFASFGLFLISALFLSGIWNLIYAFIVIGAVVLSVKLKTKIGLLISAIAIGIYCIKISVEYFADSISFSLALLISGLLIIALGYLTYYLNKKYITGKTN
jgi:hypothetical protein